MFRLSRIITIFIAICVVGYMNTVLIALIRKEGKPKRVVMPSIPPPRRRNCVLPRLRVDHRDVTRILRDDLPIKCPGQDLVEVRGRLLRVTDATRQELGDVECLVREVMRFNDSTNFLDATQRVRNWYQLRRSDFVRINCSSSKIYFEWENLMAGIRTDEEVLKRSGWRHVPPAALQYNVLLFGIHSMSRLMFERKLPRTLEFLRRNLAAIEMEGYNIVGDGPLNALFPILTGKPGKSFRQEFREGFPNTTKYINALPFIWKLYESNGFVTGFAEDAPETGVFSSRLKGFQFPPTDHYLRPFYLEEQRISKGQAEQCVGSIPRHKVMLNYILNFFRVYRTKPKFMVGYMKELTEKSVNGVGAADRDILDWLKTLDIEGHLDNAIFIIMSDHGSRHPALRSTQQGKLEERKPLLSFVLPAALRKGSSEVAQSLMTRAVELTTPFDLHQTLKDILRFKDGVMYDDFNALSLFRLVETRFDCDWLGIEDHWCTCLEEAPMSRSVPLVQDPRVVTAAEAFVAHVNALTKRQRRVCAELRLRRVHRASEFVPNESVMRFRRTVNWSTETVDMSCNATVTEAQLELVLSVTPGNAVFETTVMFNNEEGAYYFDDAATTCFYKVNPTIAKTLKEDGFAFHAYCIPKD